jgi:hypothetical protein
LQNVSFHGKSFDQLLNSVSSSSAEPHLPDDYQLKSALAAMLNKHNENYPYPFPPFFNNANKIYIIDLPGLPPEANPLF